MSAFIHQIQKYIYLAVTAFAMMILTVSCQETGDTVAIPVPRDTSALSLQNHFILKETIDEYKKAFATERDTLLRSRQNLFIPESEAFNKPAVLEILKDPKCVGLKIYYGLKSNQRNEVRLILVGVDAAGNDLYYIGGGTAAKVAGQAGGKSGGVEYGQCLPPCTPREPGE